MDLFYECLQDGKWACSKDDPSLVRYIAQNYRFRLSDTDLDDNQRILLAYNEYKYFHASARIAIYGEGDGKEIVHNYLRRFESGCDSHILIKKDNKDNKENIEYLLHVNSINLKVYNTGVAILLFQAEYYGDKMVNNEVKRTPNFDDVLAINQYGRRVCPPFISLEAGDSCPELADRLTLVIDGKEICEDFKVVVSNPEQHLNYISKIVMETLGGNFSFQKQRNSSKALRKRTFFGRFCHARKRGEGEKTIYIEPIIDDRMFVISVVRDNQLAETMREWLASENRYFYEDDVFAENSLKLYQFMFVDTKSPSCADRIMRRDLIKRHCYSRWVEEGTLYGITHQGFVCITKQDDDFSKNVITAHMLTLYTQMLMLVLAQRVFFVQFNNETSNISHNLLETTGEDFNVFKYNVDDLISLQERYNSFKARIMNFEVTAQEQGIEMYKMMQQALYISEEAAELDAQLNLVQNTVNTIMERRREIQMAVLTALGTLAAAVGIDQILLVLAFSVFMLAVTWLSFRGKQKLLIFIVLVVIVGLATAVKFGLLGFYG
ncbi:hypothetical protein [Syntrophothermus lipocalidus]|nr:hypothetical protein [Syntrophothermus lipocalidus]HOV43374.1 hypothetical protein [Syntrophothermus lipocalidus]